MVARVAPQKDFETLICATARVLAAQPDARLLLVGDNQEPDECKKYYNQLCRLAGALGIERNVIWTGFRSDVPALMSAMDVSVLATRSEGFPLTLLEAMSLGRPVVSARVGGIPEMIADGENGLLYEAGDVEGLSNQIIRLLNDVNLREGIRQRGRESVLSRFTKEKTIDQIKRVYSGLLNRSDRQSNVRRPKGIE
jgi:glycosyltransferase involved in cell wall biosynthesis